MKKRVVTYAIAAAMAMSLVMTASVSAAEEDKNVVKMQTAQAPEHGTLSAPNENLLTGIADLSDGAIGKRPVAVMVNNVEDALPQLGIGEADIIFEIPVEGDLTRFMALYGDYTAVPQVCSVRSCRDYFPALSEGFDAFYVNWGIDDNIGYYLGLLDLDQFEGMENTGGLFGRNQSRLDAGYSLEHTGYFDGPSLPATAEALGMRTDIEADKKDAAFLFAGVDEKVKPAEKDCKTVNIDFGQATATLTYDEATGTYLKQINGHAQVDGNTNEQLAFTNVFVLETDISVRDEVGHKDVDWDGRDGAIGYYISNGGMQKITWEKLENNEQSRMHFYDMNGNELKINRGKSYIAVNYKNQATFQ